MTEGDWHSAPIADLLLHSLTLHRDLYGAEAEDSFELQGPHSALRVDLARKHMLLAYAIAHRYWLELDPQVQNALATLEAFENAPSIAPEPPLDGLRNGLVPESTATRRL